MTPADVLWVLAVEVPLPVPMLDRACEVLAVTKADLKAARARYECNVPRPTARSLDAAHPGGFTTPEALEAVTAPGPVVAARMSRAYVPTRRFTAAGAERAARAAFLSLRVEAIKCDLCGEWIRDDEIVVIDRCHHAHCDGAS